MIEELKRLAQGNAISQSQARSLMAMILSEDTQPEQVGALLGLLHAREISAELLAGFAMELESRRVAVPVRSEILQRLVDVCGTGGDSSRDGVSTFNVSTTVAFLAAACGLPIAKHGNRAVSSRSGSFDVLEALGIPFTEDAAQATLMLDSGEIAFLFAPAFHPALKKIAPIRKLLGFRTVFNALGPLLNPVGVKRQLVGVYSRSLLRPMAEALHSLGVTHAMVVHGEDGLDEISLCAPTYITELNNGKISEATFSPRDVGLGLRTPNELKGGDPQENARIIEVVLGGEHGARADLTCLNTAGALVVGGKAKTMREGFELARQVQRSGRALDVLRRHQSLTTKLQRKSRE